MSSHELYKKMMTEEFESILDKLPGLMSHVKGNVETIAINPEKDERMLITISKKYLSKQEAIDYSAKFDTEHVGETTVIKGSEFDKHLNS